MSDTLRILVVEDNQGDAALIEELLPAGGPVGFEIEVTPRLALALERVMQERFDVVLLDLGLPDSVGLDTLRTMKSRAADLPIVVLTDRDYEQLGVAAMQEGAQDFVVKGQHAATVLGPVVRFAWERQRILQQLRASQALLRAVVDNLPDSVYVKDAAGRKTLSNPADVAHIVGVSDVSEVLGKTDRELFPPDVAARAEADDRAVLDSGVSVLNREEWGTDANGRPTWGLTTKIPLRDAGGNITGLVGITRSITRQKQAEELLKSRLDELVRWQDVMLGREDRVQELKGEINDLCRRLGEEPRYPSQEADSANSASVEKGQ